MYRTKILKNHKPTVIESLEKEHIKYLKQKGWEKYKKMSKQQQNQLDKEFPKWWAKKDPFSMFIFGQLCPPGIKKFYLAEMLLSWEEFDFIEWAKNKGHVINMQNKFTLVDIMYYDENFEESKNQIVYDNYEELDEEELEFKNQIH